MQAGEKVDQSLQLAIGLRGPLRRGMPGGGVPDSIVIGVLSAFALVVSRLKSYAVSASSAETYAAADLISGQRILRQKGVRTQGRERKLQSPAYVASLAAVRVLQKFKLCQELARTDFSVLAYSE